MATGLTPASADETLTDAGALSVEDGLGPALIRLGKLDAAGLERARRAQAGSGRPLASVLSGLGLATERDIADGFAALLDIPIVDRADYPAAPVLEDVLGAAFLRGRHLVPLSDGPGTVRVAMADPLDQFALRAMEVKLGRPIERLVAVPSELDEALERLYGEGRASIADIVEGLENEADGADAADDAERLKDLASEAPVIRLVSLLIDEAVARKASDIHIEPFDNRLRVRYRIDGVMHEVASHPSRLRFAVISRLKVMAKLNIAERRLPQDGRIRLSVRGTQVDLRVSTVPTEHGESIVLRVLDRSTVVLDYGRLGFEPEARDAIR